ncbi:MAG: hypothetical protein KME05_04440 [Gloeocapsa sp. UFS-A4-WI-NPMV-4B04]|jgi:outer membrane biosynthesis protein TonB|nr:hypothetical protein [Gloeocapsa sp. UFS-A4-WI-NPMV-4B04]
MKLNYNVTLTLILLTLMLGAGYMSSRLGFAVGHEAIEGVSQPDARPTSKIKNRKAASAQQGALVLLKEEDILNTVKARIEGKGKNAKPEKPQPQNKELPQEKPAQKPQAAKENYQPGFPITSRNQKVTLDVVSAGYSGGALLIKVNLKNEGDKTVRFLYSFLDVTDDQGRALSANTEGLPTELTANGKTFSGTMSIPTALLDDVNKLSMTLTDYPDQKLRLQVSDIPVKK